MSEGRIKELIATVLPYAAWFSAFFALMGILVQANRARYALAIDLILKFGQRFDTSEMRAIRSKAGKALLLSTTDGNDCVDDVLNFFEEIGFLVDRKAIDEEAAWEFFYYWVVRYHTATIRYRKFLHDELPTEAEIYRHFESLSARLRKIERNRLPRHKRRLFADLSDREVKDFLEDEEALAEKPPRFRITRTAR
ncbi:MAG: hypothetical protein HY067_03900 [Betaproteobacteria bacterium]|nr:hypothetical protein [Betaproteobacteria bacterium]